MRKPRARGAVLSLAAFVFIFQTNIQIVHANIYYAAARSDLQQQRYDQAIARYRTALTLDPGQGLYQLELAQSLVSKAVYTRMSPAERDRLIRQAERARPAPGAEMGAGSSPKTRGGFDDSRRSRDALGGRSR